MKQAIDMKRLMVYLLLTVIALAFVVGVLPELRFYAAHPELSPKDIGEYCLEGAQSFRGVGNNELRQCLECAVIRRKKSNGGAR